MALKAPDLEPFRLAMIGKRFKDHRFGSTHRVVPCDCERCRGGGWVAFDRYLGREFPAVFPHLGDRPSHVKLGPHVTFQEDVAEVERRALELQVGVKREA